MIWRKYRLTITEPGLITTQIETTKATIIETYIRQYLRRCERIQIDLVQTAMSTEDRTEEDRRKTLWNRF